MVAYVPYVPMSEVPVVLYHTYMYEVSDIGRMSLSGAGCTLGDTDDRKSQVRPGLQLDNLAEERLLS